MTPFLKLVADDVYKRLNGHLEDVAVVFPNKRAGLFFNRYLLESSNNAPLWSPKYLTVADLFQQNSPHAIGDPILLVSKPWNNFPITVICVCAVTRLWDCVLEQRW